MNIKEIAALCDVSTTTISRVINNDPRVTQKTRSHVKSIMKKYNYTPNAFARGLILNSMRMIGILCTNIDDPYYAKATSLIESEIKKHGYNSILGCTGNNLEDKIKHLDLLLKNRVDAIILIGSAFRENTENDHIRTAAKQSPVIIINGLIEIPGVYCVLCDEKESIIQNVRLLTEQNKRNIMYVYDVLTYSGLQKLSGYRIGLELCGIKKEISVSVKIGADINEIRNTVADALKLFPETDAIMASEDFLAIGAQKAMAELGKNLPLIGFDNSRYAQCATPSLTSVDNMLDSICPIAVKLLIDLLNGKKVPSKIIMPTELIERETFVTKKSSTV